MKIIKFAWFKQTNIEVIHQSNYNVRLGGGKCNVVQVWSKIADVFDLGI